VRFFIGLAVLAGLARFVPYVGPAVTWTTYGLVSYFQGTTIFGLSPFGYVILVVGTSWVVDIILDNFVGTRLMGNVLQIHPAAVMVSALVGANLFGLVGVVLAAPVVATLKLVMTYIFNRLFDQDPWKDIRMAGPPDQRPIFATIYVMLRHVQKRIRDYVRTHSFFPIFIRSRIKE
jgi:predicted PurR-regulated permease PerM